MQSLTSIQIFKHSPLGFPTNMRNEIIPTEEQEKILLEKKVLRTLNGFEPLCLEEDVSLKARFKTPGYIVGKGPSLDSFDWSKIEPNCPIIGINEAYLVLKAQRLSNPIYFVQADCPYKKYVTSEDVKFVTQKAARFYHDQENLNVIESSVWPIFLTSTYAIKLLNYFGCTKINLIAFDSFKGIEGYTTSLTPDFCRGQIVKVPNHIVHVKNLIRLLTQINLPYEVL